MKTVGIVGGIASGKSLVADQFRALGALVIDADRLGHEVLELTEVREAIRLRWGEAVIGLDGNVDRAVVARHVFHGSSQETELAFLEQLTHPRIGSRLRMRIADARSEGRVPAIVVDAPLLFRAHLDELCDEIVFVDAPLAVREARAVGRGWSVEELHRREAAQDPLDRQRQRATWILPNAGNQESCRQEVARFWREKIG